jgi:YHS domain-containing protein
MARLTARESHLRRVEKKRKAMIKGKKYHFSNKKPSPKFRKILENNCLILKQLSRES